MSRVHKKRDGYLLIHGNGRARYLTKWEALLWRLLRRVPVEVQR